MLKFAVYLSSGPGGAWVIVIPPDDELELLPPSMPEAEEPADAQSIRLHSLLLLLLVLPLLAEPDVPPPTRPELELVLLVSPSLPQLDEEAPPPKRSLVSASASHSVSVSPVVPSWRGARTSSTLRT